MKDLINNLFSNFPWFKADSGSHFSTSDAVAYARENNLVGCKLTDKDGTAYRINTNKYWYKGQEKESLWINKISEKEVESSEMTATYSVM